MIAQLATVLVAASAALTAQGEAADAGPGDAVPSDAGSSDAGPSETAPSDAGPGPGPVDAEPLAPEGAAPKPIEPREVPLDAKKPDADADADADAKPTLPVTVVDEPKPPPRPFLSTTKAALGGRFGVSAGNVLLVPFVVPGPGLFFTGGQRFTFFDVWFIEGDVGLSVGISSEGDVTSLIGYKGRLAGGYRLLFDHAYFDVDAHMGLTSVLLIPTPRVGLGLELGAALPIGAGFTLDGAARADLDVLIVLPAPSVSFEAGVSWKAGAFRTRLRVGVDGEALILVLSNTLSASVYATLSGALELP